MGVLWCGGEDIDFPNGSTPVWSTVSGRFISTHARGCVSTNANGSLNKSTVFPGGEITSGYLSCQMWLSAIATSKRLIGLGKSGGSKGIFVGLSTSSSSKIAVYKYDGSTATQLATESGNSIATSTKYKIDLQITNFGASSYVSLWVDDSLKINNASVDSSISGVTGLDSVFMADSETNTHIYCYSEIVVADTSTIGIYMVTLAPSAAGDSNAWTGAYTDIDEGAVSDADLVYTNTAAQDCLVNLTNTPGDAVPVAAIKIAARAWKSGDASIGTLKLGVKSDGTVDVDSGQALSTTPATYERYATQINSAQLTVPLLDALQLALRSSA